MYPKDRSGSAALEFALVLWPFLALIFAIFDLGHYMMAQHELHTLAGEVARACLAKTLIDACDARLEGVLAMSVGDVVGDRE